MCSISKNVLDCVLRGSRLQLYGTWDLDSVSGLGLLGPGEVGRSAAALEPSSLDNQGWTPESLRLHPSKL